MSCLGIINGWLVVLGFNATFTTKVGDANVFPGFLTPALTQLCFPKPPTIFLTCFCRGERRVYPGKKSCLKWGSNSNHQVTTEPPWHGRNNQVFQSIMNSYIVKAR